MRASDVRRALAAVADPDKAAFYPKFFKAGKGEYAEGDRFVGVVVPEQRRIARRFHALAYRDVRALLNSAFHEHRNTALLILSEKVRRGDESTAEEVFAVVLDRLDLINHWDLVDLAAPRLIGPRIVARPERCALLDELVTSDSLWRRRISIMSTLAFIRAGELELTLRLAERLFDDPEELIHKAVGWMLREVGNRDRAVLCRVLDEHAAQMPRVMLRYSVEKLPERMRRGYLARRSVVDGGHPRTRRARGSSSPR